MPRPIVFEGPDGGGKSTTIYKISEFIDRPVIHTGGPPVNKEELRKRLRKIKARGRNVIFDRIPHISEQIYSEINDREPYLTDEELLADLLIVNPVIVYCRRVNSFDMYESISRTDKAHKPKAHLEEVLHNYKKVVPLYDQLMGRTLRKQFPVFYYDWKTTPFTELMEFLKCAD